MHLPGPEGNDRKQRSRRRAASVEGRGHPPRVAEYTIKGNKSGSLLLITPGKFPILPSNFKQLGSVERSSELSHQTSVQV